MIGEMSFKAAIEGHPLIEHVYILGDEVRVEHVEPGQFDTEDDSCDAIYTSHDSLIRIRKDCDTQGLLRIILHEITHAHLAWTGMSRAINAICGEGAKDLEEALCDLFSTVLVDLVDNNPDLIKAIQGSHDVEEG